MTESKLPPEWEYETIEGPFELMDLVDEWLISREQERSTWTRVPGHYYISEIPYCFRTQYFSWYPIDNSIRSAKSLRAMYLGVVLEENVALPALNHKFGKDWVKPQGRVSIAISDLPGVQLRGKWDFFIMDKKTNSMIEFKTEQWGTAKRFEPSPHHLLQHMPYVHVAMPPCSTIAYMMKGDLFTKTFWMPYLPKVMEEVLGRTRHIHCCVDNQEMPEPEAKLCDRRWECTYICSEKERELCKAIEKRELEVVVKGGKLVES